MKILAFFIPLILFGYFANAEDQSCYDPRGLHSEMEDRWAKVYEFTTKDRLVVIMKSQNQSIGETSRTVFSSRAYYRQYKLLSKVEDAIKENKLICVDPKNSHVTLLTSSEKAWPDSIMKIENSSQYDPNQFTVVVKDKRIEYWNKGENVFTEWHPDDKSASERLAALNVQLVEARKNSQPISIDKSTTGRIFKKTWGSLKAHVASKSAFPLLEEEPDSKH